MVLKPSSGRESGRQDSKVLKGSRQRAAQERRCGHVLDHEYILSCEAQAALVLGAQWPQ